MKDKTKGLPFSELRPNEFRTYTEVTNALSISGSISPELPNNNPLLFFKCSILDHSGRQFACIHGHCPDQAECIKNGLLHENLEFYSLQYHSEDRLLWQKNAFPDIMRFVDSVSVENLSDYRLIFNHRYIRKDGSISQFMHEGTLAFIDERSLPLIKLSVFAEIGDFKTDESMILTIFRYQADVGYQKVFRKVYGGLSNSLLSHREMEIIRLCHEGFSSKMIAEKLNLSIHTVKNHKRNSMNKTLTHNISELIHQCIKNNWL